MRFPETFRHVHPFVGNDSTGGFFKIPHYDKELFYFNCIANNGEEWEHVAITIYETGKRPNRCPTWEEMCFIKSLFWEDEEPAMQLHPPKSQWVNNHPYCLHLWKPKKIDIPLPPSIMIGMNTEI